MDIQLKKHGDIPVIHIGGSLSTSIHCNELIHAVENEVFPDSTHFVIEMSDLTYMNSEGIGTFMTLFTKARNRNGEMVLVGLNATIKKLLTITKLEHIFNIEESVDDAANFLNK